MHLSFHSRVECSLVVSRVIYVHHPKNPRGVSKTGFREERCEPSILRDCTLSRKRKQSLFCIVSNVLQPRNFTFSNVFQNHLLSRQREWLRRLQYRCNTILSFWTGRRTQTHILLQVMKITTPEWSFGVFWCSIGISSINPLNRNQILLASWHSCRVAYAGQQNFWLGRYRLLSWQSQIVARSRDNWITHLSTTSTKSSSKYRNRLNVFCHQVIPILCNSKDWETCSNR